MGLKRLRKTFLRIKKQGDCWLWQGNKNLHGYGMLEINKKKFYAHRISFQLFIGKIPGKLVIDHLCRTPSCINPLHLEPVSVAENILRGFSVAAINKRKTHCKNGHAFTLGNFYSIKSRNGKKARLCKKCWNLYIRMRRAKIN